MCPKYKRGLATHRAFLFLDRRLRPKNLDFYCVCPPMPILSLLSFLFSFAGASSVPGASIAQELTDLHRGMHSLSMGYLDAGQMQSMVGNDRADHSAYGNLKGFQQTRRVTGLLMGPDSGSISKIGLMGHWQSGGWTRDLYLTSPPALHRQDRHWGLGLAGSRTDQQWFTAGGWYHLDPEEWKDDRGYRVSDGSDEFWGLFRFRRWGVLSVVGTDGPKFGRLSYFTDPTPFGKFERHWFWPQCEAALVWNQADWNPWNPADEVGAQIRFPVLGERVALRMDAGQEGPRLFQVQSNLDPQGNVGLDLSWSAGNRVHGPGIRFRAPLFTFSLNDPEDVSALGMSRRSIVWSLRLQMTWEGSEMWYRPGRRPDVGGSL